MGVQNDAGADSGTIINDLSTNLTQTWSSTKLTGHFALTNHIHNISDVTDLGFQLSQKAPLLMEMGVRPHARPPVRVRAYSCI